MATDYDKGELTDREKQAGKNQNALAKYNDQTQKQSGEFQKKAANTIEDWTEQFNSDIAKKNKDRTTAIANWDTASAKKLLQQQLQNYDFANQQNASLRDTQFTQSRQKSSAERFEAQRQLRNAALGLLGSMGNTAMNSSTTGNLMSMLRDRNDMENVTHWQTLQDNLNQIQNAYDESYNQNQVAKRDSAINAVKALRDIESGWSSDLNNIQNGLWTDIGNARSQLFTTLSNIISDTTTNRRNMRGDLAANLNNINPNLFVNPGSVQSVQDKANAYEKQMESMVAMYNGTKNMPAPVKAQYDNLKEQVSNLRSSLPSLGAVNFPDSFTIPKGESNIFEKRYSNIYQAPGTNKTMNNAVKYAEQQLANTPANQATLLNILMPAVAEQSVVGKRNRLQGNDYFSSLVNGYNNR